MIRYRLIAKKYGTSTQALVKLNEAQQIEKRRSLAIGQSVGYSKRQVQLFQRLATHN